MSGADAGPDGAARGRGREPSDGDAALQRVALTAAATAGFLTPFMGSAVNISLPAIGAELHMNAVALGWVTGAFLLGAGVFLLPFGRLADIHGRKRFFVAGMLLFTLTSILCALAPSGAALIAARLLEGVGGALVFGTGTAILTSVFPPHRLGRALGIQVAAVYLGLSLGPFLGGVLTEHFGWRSIYLFAAPIAFAAGTLTALRLRGEWAGASGERFEGVGAALYAGALIALMVGLSRLPARSGALLTGLGAVGLGVFTAWEARTPQPLLDPRLFRENAVFAFSNLAALISYSATFGVPFLLSLYLQYVRGMGPEAAGSLLVAQPIVQAILSPAAGRLSEWVEPRVLASGGMALTAAGLLLLTGLSPVTSTAHLVLVLALLGTGFALFSSPNTTAIMSSVAPRLYGVASGVLGTMRLLGQMLSMAAVLLIFSLLIGATRITPELHPAFLHAARLAFGIFAALCALGVVASLKRGRVRPG
ncbi:MAG TPA: MFS transporter [Longimicrobiales bacterium]|nr:MFS transporter [Longimicrobiales bacterium]